MDLAEVIVVIGGCDRKGLLKLPFADAYHPGSQRWTPLPSLPGYTRSEFASCALRNDIYVSGEGASEIGASSFPPTSIFSSSEETGAGRAKTVVRQSLGAAGVLVLGVGSDQRPPGIT